MRRRLEFAGVVVAFGAIVIAYAYGYRAVVATIEGYTFQRNVEEMRKAAAMEVVAYTNRSRRAELRDLEGTNPVELLEEPMPSYHGVQRDRKPREMPRGAWWFDEGQGLLIYRVEHPDRFRGGPEDGPDRVRLRVEVQPGEGLPRALHIEPVEPYEWRGTELPGVGD